MFETITVFNRLKVNNLCGFQETNAEDTTWPMFLTSAEQNDPTYPDCKMQAAKTQVASPKNKCKGPGFVCSPWQT